MKTARFNEYGDANVLRYEDDASPAAPPPVSCAARSC
jgi:hypothetical protein